MSSTAYDNRADKRHKIAANNLFIDALKTLNLPFGDIRTFVLEHTECNTIKALKQQGVKSKRIHIANYEKNICDDISKQYPRVKVNHQPACEFLKSVKKKFHGMFLDYCGTPRKCISDLEILFKRRLFEDNAILAVTLCRRGVGNDKDLTNYLQTICSRHIAVANGYKVELLENSMTQFYKMMTLTFFKITKITPQTQASTIAQGMYDIHEEVMRLEAMKVRSLIVFSILNRISLCVCL